MSITNEPKYPHTVVFNERQVRLIDWRDPEWQSSELKGLTGSFSTDAKLQPYETLAITAYLYGFYVEIPCAIIRQITETFPGSKVYEAKWESSGEYTIHSFGEPLYRERLENGDCDELHE